MDLPVSYLSQFVACRVMSEKCFSHADHVTTIVIPAQWASSPFGSWNVSVVSNAHAWSFAGRWRQRSRIRREKLRLQKTWPKKRKRIHCRRQTTRNGGSLWISHEVRKIGHRLAFWSKCFTMSPVMAPEIHIVKPSHEQLDTWRMQQNQAWDVGIEVPTMIK